MPERARTLEPFSKRCRTLTSETRGRRSSAACSSTNWPGPLGRASRKRSAIRLRSRRHTGSSATRRSLEAARPGPEQQRSSYASRASRWNVRRSALLRILGKYFEYYNGTRCHLSLAGDAPKGSGRPGANWARASSFLRWEDSTIDTSGWRPDGSVLRVFPRDQCSRTEFSASTGCVRPRRAWIDHAQSK